MAQLQGKYIAIRHLLSSVKIAFWHIYFLHFYILGLQKCQIAHTMHGVMCDVEHIKQWMAERGVSQADLAARLHCGRSTLNRVLSGKRPLSTQMAARLKELMQADEAMITAEVPEDVAEQLMAWAEAAKSTIDEVVRKLLADLPRIKR
jgi:transcriptional regulator with XRE-family HTH domain